MGFNNTAKRRTQIKLTGPQASIQSGHQPAGVRLTPTIAGYLLTIERIIDILESTQTKTHSNETRKNYICRHFYIDGRRAVGPTLGWV